MVRIQVFASTFIPGFNNRDPVTKEIHLMGRPYPEQHIISSFTNQNLSKEELIQVATELVDCPTSMFQSYSDGWGWIAEREYLEKLALKTNDHKLITLIRKLIQKRQKRWEGISRLLHF